uniref:Secreted frizzled related protein Sfrp1b n=1 Tax=Isodiametra pulchra TaxID=504439 RepID=A0A2P1DV85_ISOPU|nr:secreted frizzled related protein Sfrp1b [Isodiametra pulchra]
MALLLSTVVFILSIKASSGYSCHPIPTELSLCHNFTTIKTLRLPNGLGHSMIGQVIQQAVEFDSAFSQINCHKDTTLYACSLLTPFCYERNPSLKIEPCRSFCERIAGACLENLLMFGIETPDYLKCENFNNDGLCFDPEKSNQVEELTTLMGAPIEGSSPVTSPPSGSLDVATLDRRNMFTEQEFVANLHALQTKADKIKIIVRAKMRNAIQTKKRFATARIKSSPIRKFLDRRNLIDSNFTVPRGQPLAV